MLCFQLDPAAWFSYQISLSNSSGRDLLIVQRKCRATETQRKFIEMSVLWGLRETLNIHKKEVIAV